MGDHVYGVDIVIPGKYEGMGELDPVKLEAQLQSMVPDDHRRFARRLLDEHGIPETPADQQRSGMMGWTEATGKPLLAAALRHDKVRLIANALGTPPADVIAEVQASGRLIGALAGSVKHALHHKEAGLDFIVCQGTEGGGHTGEIGSLVLWPEVIDAVSPLPVLAAGGVGTGRQIAAALAMGAQGVWTGTLWLTVEEADTAPGQMKCLPRGQVLRHRPLQVLHGQALPHAQERLDRGLGPRRHPRPAAHAAADDGGHRRRRRRRTAIPSQSKDVAFNPCGQIIGRATQVRKARDVIYEPGRGVRRGGRPPGRHRPGVSSTDGADIRRWLVANGRHGAVKDGDPASTAGAPGRRSATEALLPSLREELARWQGLLWAEGRRSLLVVLQAMDAGGKDGTISHVFRSVNPQGTNVTAFKQPSPVELAHDFLWRVHRAVPHSGEIGIFNRSHYEDVLTVRVHRLVPEKVWRARYEAINGFEHQLAEAGTTIVKLWLHISSEEQRRRLLEPRRPAREAVEAPARRPGRAPLLGRLPGGRRRDGRPDLDVVGAVVRDPVEPQVVSELGRQQNPDRHVG